MQKLFLTSLLLLSLVGVARAADNSKQLADAVAPFIDEQTIAVISLDLSGIDVDALDAWAAEIIKTFKLDDQDAKEMLAGMKTGTDFLRTAAADLRKAGARHMYLFMSMSDMPAMPIVVPLDPGANEEAISERLLRTFGPAGLGFYGDLKAQTLAKALVIAPESTLKRLRENKSPARPEIAAAFAAAGGAPLCAILSLSPDERRVITELAPNLPKELGGGSTVPFSQGMSWATLAINLPPKLSLQVAAQCKDARAANDLAEMIAGIKRAVVQLPSPVPMQQVLDAFTPMPTRDRLALSLDTTAINERIIPLIAPPMRAARSSAKQVKSASQIKQFYNACKIYELDHKGEWPDNLESLLVYLKDPQIFVNPTNPQKKMGYVYLKPTKLLNGLILFYEAFDQWPSEGLAVGYSDGSVSRVRSEQQFREQLKATEAKNAGK